jgi:hypothetical protein
VPCWAGETRRGRTPRLVRSTAPRSMLRPASAGCTDRPPDRDRLTHDPGGPPGDRLRLRAARATVGTVRPLRWRAGAVATRPDHDPGGPPATDSGCGQSERLSERFDRCDGVQAQLRPGLTTTRVDRPATASGCGSPSDCRNGSTAAMACRRSCDPACDPTGPPGDRLRLWAAAGSPSDCRNGSTAAMAAGAVATRPDHDTGGTRPGAQVPRRVDRSCCPGAACWIGASRPIRIGTSPVLVVAAFTVVAS